MNKQVQIDEAQATKAPVNLVISPPKISAVTVTIRGTAPYVQHAFSEKALNTMVATQEAGQQARSRKKREAKDFDEVYENAKHVSTEDWCGIPAGAFRNAMISSCRLIGFKMTLAKLSVFIQADGYDASDGTPLVRITKGEPHPNTMMARNANGSTDIRRRPMWDAGWEANVKIVWDADQFSVHDVFNLLARAGFSAGIGEGRPDSKNSAGLGWGTFEVLPQ